MSTAAAAPTPGPTGSGVVVKTPTSLRGHERQHHSAEHPVSFDHPPETTLAVDEHERIEAGLLHHRERLCVRGVVRKRLGLDRAEPAAAIEDVRVAPVYKLHEKLTSWSPSSPRCSAWKAPPPGARRQLSDGPAGHHAVADQALTRLGDRVLDGVGRPAERSPSPSPTTARFACRAHRRPSECRDRTAPCPAREG